VSRNLTQDDSLQAANSTYSYEEFLELWKTFNYEYLVLVPENKVQAVEGILGEEVDETIAWQNSLTQIQDELSQDPHNPHLLFNLAINYYYTGDYQKATQTYELVKDRLTMRKDYGIK